MNRNIIFAITAVPFLASGVVMSLIGIFTEPRGEISDSALKYFTLTPIYEDSVMGIKSHVDHRVKK